MPPLATAVISDTDLSMVLARLAQPTRRHLEETALVFLVLLIAPIAPPVSMELRFVLPAHPATVFPVGYVWPAHKDSTLLEAQLYVRTAVRDVLHAQ